MSTHKQLVLSGMQPTNTLHLGNYLGALKNWVRMQNEMPCFFCVVDMHALTQDSGYALPADVRKATREVAAAYIASGVDPKHTPIFAQSMVKEHAELAWIFNCVARLGWLDRMTQFKEKSGKHKERSSVGLYTYPVLMAADICVYKATHVPVGEDQKQHLELARDIAQKFNNDYQVPDYFPLPEPVITGPGTRVMSLRDGAKKMSKTDESQFAHQPDGRRRHHHEQDSPREDRSQSASRKREGTRGAAGSGELAQHLCRPRGETGEGCDRAVRGPAILRLQERAGGIGRGEAQADRGRDAPVDGRLHRDRPHFAVGRGESPRGGGANHA